MTKTTLLTLGALAATVTLTLAAKIITVPESVPAEIVFIGLAPANKTTVFLKGDAEVVKACIKKIGRGGENAITVSTNALIECVKKGS